MNAKAAIVKALIKKYDGLRKTFFAEDVVCYLLAGDGETDDFKIKAQLAAGWYLKYSEFRGGFQLYYATVNDNFGKTLKGAGYVAIGGDVYQIEQGDTVKAQENRQYWTIACTSIGGKSFTPPV